MRVLRLWTRDVVDFQLRVEEPMRPFAMAHLAASGIFDRIVLTDPTGVDGDIVIEGAKLLRIADQVGPVALE